MMNRKTTEMQTCLFYQEIFDFRLTARGSHEYMQIIILTDTGEIAEIKSTFQQFFYFVHIDTLAHYFNETFFSASDVIVPVFVKIGHIACI